MQSQYEQSRSFLGFYIAGFAHHDGLSVIDELTLGTNVDLRCEPGNPYDPEAVAVYYGDTKLGYVPRDKNDYLFHLLYFGHEDVFEARINAADTAAHPEKQFRVAVKITDKR